MLRRVLLLHLILLILLLEGFLHVLHLLLLLMVFLLFIYIRVLKHIELHARVTLYKGGSISRCLSIRFSLSSCLSEMPICIWEQQGSHVSRLCPLPRIILSWEYVSIRLEGWVWLLLGLIHVLQVLLLCLRSTFELLYLLNEVFSLLLEIPVFMFDDLHPLPEFFKALGLRELRLLLVSGVGFLEVMIVLLVVIEALDRLSYMLGISEHWKYLLRFL